MHTFCACIPICKYKNTVLEHSLHMIHVGDKPHSNFRILTQLDGNRLYNTGYAFNENVSMRHFPTCHIVTFVQLLNQELNSRPQLP